VQVVACQTNIVWEDKTANYDRVAKLLSTGTVKPGALVVLPEMFATGFSMNIAGICEGAKAETQTFLGGNPRPRPEQVACATWSDQGHERRGDPVARNQTVGEVVGVDEVCVWTRHDDVARAAWRIILPFLG